MNKSGKIGVSSENIFPVIKKFLYSEHDIFLRELVSNAVDASEKLKVLSSNGTFKGELGELKVRVSFDKDAKTITISDNGIGMSAEEIDKYINQIAFSGAEEFLDKYKDSPASIIGHFGLGFYSSFMVSERVDIISKSYTDAPAVKWSCDGSPEYTMEPAEKADRGTDIVLHIAEDSMEFLEKERLAELLNKYAKFLSIPIIFGKKQEWKDGKYVDTDEDNQVNNTTPAWTKKPSELKDEDYKAFYRELYPMQMEEPLFWIHLNVDYPFNLTGILYFPKIKSQIELQRNKIQLYSNQVFVTEEVNDIVPDYLTLLHGVIDSPDIPLNVSRSYLQSDAQVKKIASHITKKVADRLDEIFRKERNVFEEKWDSLKVFIQYGMLSDEKFYDKAKKFFLLSDVDGKKFTLDEYKTLIESNQKDKDDNCIYLYTNDKEAQYTAIKTATEKGYSVLMMDGMLDIHLISMLEQKLEKSRFVRVDSDSIHKLIQKEEVKAVSLNKDEQFALETIFATHLPKEDKRHFNVQFEALGESESPVIITQSEFMRRMQEMSKMNPGMSFYGDFPESYNLVVNSESPLIAKILKGEKDKLDSKLSIKEAEADVMKAEIEKMKSSQEGKKEDEISIENKKALEDKQYELATKEGEIRSLIQEFAKDDAISAQIIDLALLSNGLLKGEALANFVKRSQSIL